MCLEEFSDTVRRRTFSFEKSRVKFFSHDITFIRDRVQDGAFANSKFKNAAYSHIVEFDVEESQFVKLNQKEWSLSVRKVPLVKIYNIQEI